MFDDLQFSSFKDDSSENGHEDDEDRLNDDNDCPEEMIVSQRTQLRIAFTSVRHRFRRAILIGFVPF